MRGGMATSPMADGHTTALGGGVGAGEVTRGTGSLGEESSAAFLERSPPMGESTLLAELGRLIRLAGRDHPRRRPSSFQNWMKF